MARPLKTDYDEAFCQQREKLKALLFANDFPPITSGIATAFYQLWRRLPPEQIMVAAPRVGGAHEFDAQQAFPVLRLWLPLSEHSFAKMVKTIATVIYCIILGLRLRPRKLHCGQVLSSGIAGWLCKKLLGLPYVVWVYGSETVRLGQNRALAALMHKVMMESDWVISNSDYTSREFELFGVPKNKIRRIYPGVDTSYFQPAPKDPVLVNRIRLEGKLVIMTIARLDQRKGHDMVIEALPHLRKKTERFIYLIVGKGREEGRLRNMVSRLGLEKHVHFAGYVSDDQLLKYYNLCDIFVMPNRETEGTPLAGDVEGFGISFMEAGACAKPVIAGRSGGAQEAVVDGVTGLLVDPRSAKEIREAIERLSDDPDLAEKLGRQGRERAERSFDWKCLAKQVEEIL